MNSYNFTYGESEHQKYYECKLGNDYLCIFANKYKESNPNLFMTYIEKGDQHWSIGDKTYNDRMRKKDNWSSKGDGHLTSWKILASQNIEYLKKKLIHCYEHNKLEVTP